MFYKWIHRYAHAVVAVSQGVADDMSRTAGISRERINVIYNPVVTPRTQQLAGEQPAVRIGESANVPTFVAVGRLVPEKDFMTLIEGFTRLHAKRAANLAIIGDGPLREHLERRCCELGIAQNVTFLGYIKNPLPYVKSAVALVMSSTQEGFGNVLVEALSVGTPVISTDCPYGPREILAGGRYGILVPVGQPDAIADAMDSILDDRPSASLCKQRADDFNVETIAKEYINLFGQ
jgi:glycosyltransferase involved in cell wall biosynthesis